MFEKKVVNGFAGRKKVFALHRGAQIFHLPQRNLIFQEFLHLRIGHFVAGVNHGQGQANSEPGFGVGGHQHFGHFHEVRDRSAVRAAAHQNHVGAQLTQPFHALKLFASVVYGNDIYDDRARAEGGALGGFRAHRFHDTGHRHLQSASCRRRGEIQINTGFCVFCGSHGLAAVGGKDGFTAEFFDFTDGVDDADGDIIEGSLDGRRGFAATGQAILSIGLLLDENSLGGGAAAVGGENGFGVGGVLQLGWVAHGARTVLQFMKWHTEHPCK